MSDDASRPDEQSSALPLTATFADGARLLVTDDVVHSMLPLMRAVAALHGGGRVAALGLQGILESDDGRLMLADPAGIVPTSNFTALRRVEPRVSSALKIVGDYRVTNDEALGTQVEDLQVEVDVAQGIERPVFLTDLRSWEIELGHHDELTDIYLIGMLLACLACGLDPRSPADIRRFSAARGNLFALQPRLHPVLASIILEATALSRHERATDLVSLARRLETYRDQPVALQVERVLADASGAPARRAAVLTHLRDRLFDLSRRNRLIHFRATQSSLNLTEASVPIVMRVEAIRADQLCTWSDRFAAEILSGRPVSLNSWLRFEDQPQLPSAFDRIGQAARRDRAEYGFSHLRLVVAFLRWHNLKEAPEERIVSPLLWLPVELTKIKGVRDQYTLRANETEAEYNPALRHMLRQLYDIRLPETVDLSTVSLVDIHAELARQIHATEPGVRLDLQDKPAIRLILQRAVQRVGQFARRAALVRETSHARPDFSYARDDYRPLGCALFEQYVRPTPLPQRSAAGGTIPRTPTMVARAEASTFHVGAEEGHRFAWEVDLTQVTLANFNYRKMSLVNDYSDLIDGTQAQPALDQVFSVEPRRIERETPPQIAPLDQWNVVASDATQDAAVALARTGRSFIIQGPPGTGKSQTITNLIADYAARGKRVLFVCEKRAALDVVFHRLAQAGLDGLACVIHDSLEDKKSFILDLKTQYERWTSVDDGLPERQQARERTARALSTHLDSIADYDRLVGPASGVDAEPGARALARIAAALPPPPSGISALIREQLPGWATWAASRPLAQRVSRAVHELFGLDSLGQHVFARLRAVVLTHEHPIAEIDATVDTCEALLLGLDGWLNGGSCCVSGSVSIASARDVSILANRLQRTGLAGQLVQLEPGSDGSRRFVQELSEIDLLAAQCTTAQATTVHWRELLPVQDAATALEVARAQERSLFRLFNGSWRAVKRSVQARYDFAAHAVPPTVTQVLESLVQRHAADERLSAARAALAARLGTHDLDDFLALRIELAATDALPPVAVALLRAVREAPEPAAVAAREAAQAVALEQLMQRGAALVDGFGDLTFDALATLLRDLREGFEELPDVLPLLAEVHAAPEPVAFALRRLTLPLAGLEALIVDEAISRAERANPLIRRFDVDRLIGLSRRASRARELLRAENARAIQARLHHDFRQQVKLSETSVTLLSPEERQFKKRYSAGRRELEREFAKSMRYRSIRDLSSADSGAVVNDLKPIWLMSPLSVSDTLPLAPELFDVVIFDEASQIPMEDAVPALCRAPQVIVVGDEMQLPPTNFFAAALDDEDAEVVAEEDGERISILLDADSLLNQAARNLPATLLAWHYRSRSESLISFSNAAFYAGQLVTIPDRTLPSRRDPATPVQSGDPFAVEAGVERLLAAPITVHRLADGLYEHRRNPAEALYIARLLRGLLRGATRLSVGVVAFSEAQQSEVEAALERLAGEDADFAAALEREYVREDDGQFNGLFVKNLENVQGDERDIIIMSVCYAPTRDGRMAMNFGPINQRGGEKRLNVIFSRARRHMAIVTTIGPEAITNVHNDGARALKGFLAFAEAQSNGGRDQAQAILASVNSDVATTFSAELPDDPVRSELAAGLRARGHDVHERVGSGTLRCDLAIASRSGAGYALGVLLDRDSERARPVEERFVFQPDILRAFGWRVLDVPVAAWVRSREATLLRIESELARCSWDLADPDPYAGVPAASRKDGDIRSTRAARTAAPTADAAVDSGAPATRGPDQSAAPAGAVAMTEYRLIAGNSSKFWRVGVEGAEVIVEYGRIGSVGQRLRKPFDSPDRAEREMRKLAAEKLQKGYEPVP